MHAFYADPALVILTNDNSVGCLVFSVISKITWYFIFSKINILNHFLQQFFMRSR